MKDYSDNVHMNTNQEDENIYKSNFEKYNSTLEDYLDQVVDSVDYLYKLPDLSEELL